MADVKWTDEQKTVINSLDGSMIVSAAAGSGKTAVLVERIINRICSSEQPCSVDRLLVVTFTRAAANEMRLKLTSAIKKEVNLHPENRFLKTQLMMLPLAEICTMDQFFNNLVKDNFHKLGISPDYRILDNGEIRLLTGEAVEEILEEYYDNPTEDFKTLLDVLGCDKSDDNLIEVIKTLSRYSSAYPEPEKWLNGIVSGYQGEERPQDTEFGKVILKKISDYLDYSKQLLLNAKELVCGIDELQSIRAVLIDEISQADALIEICKKSEWNNLSEALSNVRFARFPTIKNEYKDSYEKIYSQALRKKARDIVSNLYLYMPANEAEYTEDIKFLNPVVKKLIELVFCYQKRLSEKKQEQNAYEFNDVEHLALKLLLNDNSEPTETALELRQKYDEILIDEYQDTNEAQDAVFCTLSNDMNNLFLVGDVKQSIYRFRLAMPSVFLGRTELWKKSEEEYPMCVNLDRNFRSRKGVLDAVNYVFKKIMSVRTGDMVYDDKESLKAGAEYEETSEAPVEIDILNKKGMPEGYSESVYIAERIESLLSSGMTVKQKDGSQKPLSYRDICVLIRTKKIGSELCEILRHRDIPAYFEESQGFFENTEVSVILSFLDILDNPLQDVPLLCVLMSPIFGFTADDIAKIRIEQRGVKLYYAVMKSELPKAKQFLNQYNEFKRLSTVLDTQSLIETIYEASGYLSIVSALKNGEIRKLNLMMLTKYAQDYESYGRTGLPGFIRYINRLKENESDLKSAGTASEFADVVRIMTVHKSKGLEFPVVILSDLGRTGRSSTDSLVIHEKTGVGLKVCDKKNFRKYDTVQYEASKTLCTLSDCSEELRILYVAMTRAKEKLIMTAAVNDIDKAAVSAATDCLGGDIHSVSVEKASSTISLLMTAFMRHPDASDLRLAAGYAGECDLMSDFPLDIHLIYDGFEISEPKAQGLNSEVKADESLIEEIRERTEYKYPYGELAFCATKKSASSFNETQTNSDFFACAVPSFAEGSGLTAAGRGTAVHRFMEVCDFKSAKENFEDELDRLVSIRKITPEQAAVIPKTDIMNFFNSSLYKRIENSEKVMREKKFTISVPLKLANPELGTDFADEQVLVQGVIDCAFYEDGGLVVLDYKTDRVKSADELTERYSRQLEIYKIAAEQSFGVKVKETLLYSFCLGEEKQVEI